MGGDGEKDRPSSESDKENAGSGDTSGLLPIGERGEEQHGNESDNIGRYSEKLCLPG
jgi:hypothetical protein